MTTPQTTGADLARDALMAARKAAAARGETSRAQAKPKRRRTARRGDGRDPIALMDAFQRLADERGWETPLAGGTVIERWSAIVSPDVASRLEPVRFDEATGRLELLAESHAWVVQGRLISEILRNQVNSALGADTLAPERPPVREIHILPPGTRRPGQARRSERPDPVQPTLPRPTVHNYAPAELHALRKALASRSGPVIAEPAPARPDEDKCSGFHQARAGIRATRTVPPADPDRPPCDRSENYHRARAGLRPMTPPTPTSVSTVPHGTPSRLLKAMHDLSSSTLHGAPPE